MRVDLLRLIGRDTELKRNCARHGGEYAGACPLCRRGTDRFRVWPALERWACLGAEAGRAGCGIGGDAVAYLRQRDGLSYGAACATLGIDPHQHGTTGPPSAWQRASSTSLAA